MAMRFARKPELALGHACERLDLLRLAGDGRALLSRPQGHKGRAGAPSMC